MRLGAKAVIKDYLLNSSFHGLRFIADDERHWTERWFWMVCVCLSWYASGLLVLASWDAFQNNAISFVMETAYKDWNTDFPAVAFCENDNEENVFEASDLMWTPVHEVDLEEVLKELAYFRGLSYYTLQVCNKPDADALCPLTNFTFYAEAVRSSCRRSIANCKYNGKSFECCNHFLPIDTDIGRCYIINSVQSKKPSNYVKDPMVNNKKHALGKLSFNILTHATIFTLGEEEVPTLTTLQSEYFLTNKKSNFRRHIAIRNIENDPNARDTTPEQRNCRYQDENFLDVYPAYSYSACTVQCRKDAQIEYCNCSDHFMPNTVEEDKCSMAGLVCLNQNYAELSVMRPAWARRAGLVCDCLPSCTETEITVIKDDETPSIGPTLVEIVVEYLPSERFKRNVVRSRLDLVGGTTGLFVGASLLSFIELIYYLTLRYYGTYYMQKKSHKHGTDYQPKEQKALVTVRLDPSSNNLPIVDIKRTRRDFYRFKAGQNQSQ